MPGPRLVVVVVDGCEVGGRVGRVRPVYGEVGGVVVRRVVTSGVVGGTFCSKL